MKPFRIFIASSGRARPLAQKLHDAINERVKVINSPDPLKKTISVTPILWWKSIPPGKDTLGGLIDQCKGCDFAAILLTQDDVTLKKGVENLQPRDNCIFEAGLFTGALNLDPRRAFLLTSVDKASESLPSDLAGIAHVRIEESGDDADGSIDSAAQNIVTRIASLGPNRRGQIPYVAEHELLALERLEADEGRLVPASRILVHTKQPLETLDNGFAERVLRNIQDEIRYRYFFHADKHSRSMIAQLIWTLAAAGVEGQTMFEKRTKMAQRLQVVRENMESIQRNLNIHLVNDEPKFELCVHNSEVLEKAICYLRVPNSRPVQFIEWCQGEAAKGIAECFLALRREAVPKAIFRSTSDFNLDEQTEYVRLLREDLAGRFPPAIGDEVCKFCFGK